MNIDLWTIGFEVVNFLVLVWLLERLLFRPVLGVINSRQAEIDRLQQADAAAQSALTAEQQRLDQALQSVAAERARVLEQAHGEAREERVRLENQARAEMERLLAASRDRLEHERADAARALRRKSAELGVSLARRLLELSTSPDGDGRFVEAVCAQLKNLAESDRARLGAGLGKDTVVRVVSAQALDPARQAECQERIAQALGHAVKTTFSVDASLIAGIEMFFPGLVLRHCWRDALADSEAALVEAAEQDPLEEGEDARHAR